MMSKNVGDDVSMNPPIRLNHLKNASRESFFSFSLFDVLLRKSVKHSNLNHHNKYETRVSTLFYLLLVSVTGSNSISLISL